MVRRTQSSGPGLANAPRGFIVPVKFARRWPGRLAAGIRRHPVVYGLGSLLVAALGASYVATLLPGVGYSGDTAEFQFAGKVLGTTHPTGYPTYLVLNHLFVRLWPFGTVAYKANLLSAVFCVTAIVFL